MSKRLKLDFQPGSIKTVTIKNFTTYSHGEFKLSPSLNMIIGPNGTGKSTLVAAICLGLGGKLELIKRKTMKSMIKTGTTESTIELVVADIDDREVIIERTFTEKSSKWKLNGRSTSEKEVISKVKSLNIQLDNLCHFLPQERVAEFAGLSPEKLLVETERTLKSGNLYLMHEDLIKLEDKRDSVIQQLETYNSRLETLQQEKEKLNEAVQALNQFNEKRNEVELHKHILPYAVWEDEKIRRRELKKQKEDAEAKLKDFENNKRPLNEALVVSLDERKRLQVEKNEKQRLYDEIEGKVEQLQREKKKNEEYISDLKGKLLSTRTSKERRRQEIINEKAEINKLNNELTQLADDDTEDQINEYKGQRRQLQNEKLTLSEAIEESNNTLNDKKRQEARLSQELKAEMSKLNTEDKLNLLNIQNSKLLYSSFQAHKFMREKSGTNEYFESPVVTCDIREKSLAGVCERVIGQNNLVALTFTNEDNYQKNYRHLQQFTVPTRVLKQQPSPPSIPQESLHHFGFENYLSDYLQGPQPVLNMLKINSKIHNIPVTLKELSDRQLNKLMTPNNEGKIPFMRFISGQQLFNVTRSRYGNRNFVYSTDTIKNTNFFGKNSISSEVRESTETNIKSLKSDLDDIHSQIKEINDKLINDKSNAVRIQRDIELFNEKVNQHSLLKSRRNRIQQNIVTKQERIEKLTQDLNKNHSDRIRNIRNRLLEVFGNNSKQGSQISDYVAQLSDIKLEINQINLDVLNERNRKDAIEALVQQMDELKSELVAIYEESKKQYLSMKNSNCKQIIAETNAKLPPLEVEKIQNKAVEYREAGELNESNIKETISILEDEISVMTADKSSIQRLKLVDEKIEEIHGVLPRLNTEKQSFDTRITEIKSRWEPELDGLVEKISRSFQRKFVNVASNGKVQLAKNEKFKKWRLEILVKFREQSDFKILDRQSQSGGERAVSTIFFVMALQGLTKAPIRIVDEINQGMDPKNEKMAHKYLVRTACKNMNSQYFLVTPKLLTGLYYHPQMKIHCIYTGPFIKSGDVDFMDFTNQF